MTINGLFASVQFIATIASKSNPAVGGNDQPPSYIESPASIIRTKRAFSSPTKARSKKSPPDESGFLGSGIPFFELTGQTPAKPLYLNGFPTG